MKLTLSKNAQFYILNKKLTKTSIKKAFTDISEKKSEISLLMKLKKYIQQHQA